MTGTIPATLVSLTSLTGMSLWGNQLTGEIPEELGNLILLEQLILHENQLSGNFPAALGTLENLKLARFASNTDADDNPSLTGCVPVGLRYLVDAPITFCRTTRPMTSSRWTRTATATSITSTILPA